MMSFGALLMTGNYMVISEWTQRLVAGSASLTGVADAYIPLGAIAGTMALVGALGWLGWEGRERAKGGPAPHKEGRYPFRRTCRDIAGYRARARP